MKRTTRIILSGIFISLVIIFTHIFALQTPFVRIGFGFIPIAVFAAKFGSVQAAWMAALADIIGCLLFSPGLFFPGFTISAALSGCVYGFFFYDKEITLRRAFLASFLIFVCIDLGLNTLWLSMLYHQAVSVFFLSRLGKGLLLFPLQSLLLYTLYKPLRTFLPHSPRH